VTTADQSDDQRHAADIVCTPSTSPASRAAIAGQENPRPAGVSGGGVQVKELMTLNVCTSQARPPNVVVGTEFVTQQ